MWQFGVANEWILGWHGVAWDRYDGFMNECMIGVLVLAFARAALRSHKIRDLFTNSYVDCPAAYLVILRPVCSFVHASQSRHTTTQRVGT